MFVQLTLQRYHKWKLPSRECAAVHAALFNHDPPPAEENKNPNLEETSRIINTKWGIRSTERDLKL